MAIRSSSPPTWRRRLDDYYWIHDLLRVGLGVPAWAILWDGTRLRQGSGGQAGELVWRDLSLVLPPMAPYHFEMAFGKDGARDLYHRRFLAKVLKSMRPAVGSLFGFEDLFVPIAREGGGGAVLYFGQFCKSLPDHARLRAQWKKLSGRDAAEGDADFTGFVATALRVPVLPGPALAGLSEFGRLYAAFLRGEESKASLEPKLDRLRKKAITPYVPHPVWGYQAIGFDRQRPVPWYPEKDLSPWMKEDLGLSRPPSLVMCLLPLHPAGTPPSQAMVLNRALQREAWVWCRRRGEVLAEPMQEEGLALLMCLPKDASPQAARLLARGLADELRAFVKARFGLRCAIGVGAAVNPGERLYPSYRQAGLALQLSLQMEKPQLFFEDIPTARGGAGYGRLARAAWELLAVFEQGTPEPMKLALDEYILLVLEYAGGRLEAARGQLLAAFFQLLDSQRRRYALKEEDLDPLAAPLSSALEQAGSMAALLEAFKSALRRLFQMAEAGPSGRGALRMEKALAWIRDNSSRPLSLSQAAKAAGLSLPGFTRAFRKATGSAFLPYLRNLRVEEAKRLLRHSQLSVLEIAPLCGFSSSHHFIRSFHKISGENPEQFRKKAKKRA